MSDDTKAADAAAEQAAKPGKSPDLFRLASASSSRYRGGLALSNRGGDYDLSDRTIEQLNHILDDDLVVIGDRDGFVAYVEARQAKPAKAKAKAAA